MNYFATSKDFFNFIYLVMFSLYDYFNFYNGVVYTLQTSMNTMVIDNQTMP